MPRKAWLNLRGEAVSDYLVKASRTVGSRPLYMDLPKQEPGARYIRPYGGVPFHAESWVRDGAVAGIRMLGIPADQTIKHELVGAEQVRIVRFVDYGRMGTPNEFRENLQRWLGTPALDEIELYETLLYTDRPEYLRIIRDTLLNAN